MNKKYHFTQDVKILSQSPTKAKRMPKPLNTRITNHTSPKLLIFCINSLFHAKTMRKILLLCC